MKYPNVEERIAARNKEAQYHIENYVEDGFAHTKAKAGLEAANLTDRVTSVADGKAGFLAMMASGAVRGAFYGAVAAFCVVACIGLPLTGLVALSLYAGCMATGAATYSIVDSQTHLDLAANGAQNRLPDRIAQESGAVKNKLEAIEFNKAMFKSPERKEYVNNISKILEEKKEAQDNNPEENQNYYREQALKRRTVTQEKRAALGV